MNLKGRNFLKLMDFTPEEITYMVDLAADLKAKKKQGIPHDSLTGKNIALIFEKTSTRTRCSFEVAKAAGYEKFIMFLHYPPIFATNFNYDILDVLYRYKIEECYYGHIHGKAHQYAFEGVYEETKMHLISGDYIQFKPVKIV